MPVHTEDTNFCFGRNQQDDIVISGFSGRLPECSNIKEFMDNLYNGVDMVNDDPRKWPKNLYDLPARSGKMKQEDIENFDHTFFGIHPMQAECMDPCARMLLEVTYEAIIDSGFNPKDLRGSRTGVYVGVSVSETEHYLTSDPDLVTGYGLTGFARTIFANRVSFAFDFKGPSYAVDTASSSSMFAMDQAFQDIRRGRCDSAIVAGCSVSLTPRFALHFKRIGVLSPDGTCRAFDEDASGYARSEACVALFLQRAKNSRRIYATILNTLTNTEGAKEMGIAHPDGVMQMQLFKEAFEEINLNPLDVTYVEAHGTGTKVGDPEEVNGVCDFFCKDRTTPLLIGSVKSNIGHPEAAAGVCSISKVLIAMDQGIIPGNLHYNKPNPALYGILDGRLKVVDKNTPWNGGIVILNSFGVGGTNAHVILKSNPKPRVLSPLDRFQRMAIVSGRTVNAVETLLSDIEEQADDEEYLAMVNDIHSKDISQHKYRGYTVMSSEGPSREVNQIDELKRPVWFVYSGMGSQWAHMGRELMQIQCFSNSINRCAEALRPEGIDLFEILFNYEESRFDVLTSFVSITAIQVALTDILTNLNIIPDGIVGHSSGELGCAYADGCFTPEQSVLAAYWRGRSLLDANLEPRLMASVGLTREECEKRLPQDIFIACHNSIDNVTISGPVDSVTAFSEDLNKEGIFIKIVNSSGCAFHSKYVAAAGPDLKKHLSKLIPNPKNRSEKWKSSSVVESLWHQSLAKHSSADYHVNNLLSPVLFYEAIQHIPGNAICIEIAPHGLLQSILRRSLGTGVTCLSLMKRHFSNNTQTLLSNIGKLYLAGAQPGVNKLFRQISYPVARGTPMLNYKIGWDHSQKWPVANFGHKTETGQAIFDYNLAKERDEYLAGHNFDGRVLFPATGYIFLAWRQYAKSLENQFDHVPVVFENVVFHRATILPPNATVKLGINFLDGSSRFEICESNALVVSGYIRQTDSDDNEELPLDPLPEYKHSLLLDINDVYKDLRLRGYDYNGLFQGIVQSDSVADTGKLEFLDQNWVTFMDAMLQFNLLSKDRLFYLPQRIDKVIINPEKHLQLAQEYATDNSTRSVFPVYNYKDISLIECGGVKIRGVHLSSVPRRHMRQPILERYTFIPNYNVQDLSDEKAVAREHAITSAVHLCLENCKGVLKIKTAELVLDKTPESLISVTVEEIIETETSIVSDIVVVTADDSADELQKIVKDRSEIRFVVKDPLTGVVESGCHLCIAVDILKKSNGETILKNLKDSIREDGFILLEESYTGKTNKENNLFTQLNLVVVSTQTCDNREFILLRPEFDFKNQNIQVVNVTEKHFEWFDTLKSAILSAESENKIVYIVCQGDEQFGALGFMNCLKFESGGKRARMFFIQDCKAPTFSLTNPFYQNQLKKDLIHNVVKNNAWGTFRHLKLECKQGAETLPVEHAYINTLIKGNLSSLKWIEGPLLLDLPDTKQELCTVYYAPINSRDVMIASGKLSVDALPGDLAQQNCVLGVEFSGRDSRGNRVMGLVHAKSLATSCLAQKNWMWQVPDTWTLEEASTIPCAYSTVYYALVMQGKMKKGESILIHAGAGGIGQAAISVAHSAGLTVFTTVGSQEKREFLKNKFPQLTDRHIGNSRDSSFQQLIMRETRGRGVDLVVNSLHEFFEASVRCLGANGRFLQIGKLDLDQNNPLGMSVYNNISFHGIPLDSVINSDDETIVTVVKLVNEGIKTGAVRPLPTTVYGDQQVEEAFRFLESGKHIGKVVIKLRDEEEQRLVIPKSKLTFAVPRTYLHKDKTYIIIGGLGGFALEIINWFVSRGARKIIATSRSGIKTGYQSLMIRRWREQGVHVLVDTNDATTQKGAEQLLKEATKLGPVGGIFNLATVFRDCLLEDQKQADFRIVCAPKVDATRCLDAASRSLCPELDYFICFSSLSCARGNVGQGSYGLANSAMERICEARKAAGYPSLAIQWGTIGDTGHFIEHLGDNDTILIGTLPQRMVSCLEIMDHFMQHQQQHPVLLTMVVGDKRIVDSSSKLSLVNCIADIMGIKDLKKISDAVTLADFGMDSLMGVEIKQILEINFDMLLTAQDIRHLTFGKLKALDDIKVSPVRAHHAQNDFIRRAPRCGASRLAIKREQMEILAENYD
ncbi:Fatty acid synthase [Sergentomyia squamirostris]